MRSQNLISKDLECYTPDQNSSINFIKEAPQQKKKDLLFPNIELQMNFLQRKLHNSKSCKQLYQITTLDQNQTLTIGTTILSWPVCIKNE